MIIIKSSDNDLSFITDSLHCKENMLENKGINLIKGADYEPGRICGTYNKGRR